MSELRDRRKLSLVDGNGEVSARSPRKPKGEGYLRRAEILQIAQEIFVREGYERSTIRKIAEQVGVSTTTLYMHFPDKDSIMLEISRTGLQDLEAIHDDYAQRIADPVERLRLMMAAYIEFGLKNPSLYELLFCLSDRTLSAETQRTAAEMGVGCFNRFTETVVEIAVDGRLGSGDVAATLQAIWTACHGLTHMLNNNPKFPWAPQDQLLHLLVDALITGLTKPLAEPRA